MNVDVIFEQKDHHQGSIYCLDWSTTSRLIASGSNDKTIKLLVCPDFEHQQQTEQTELLELVLEGHPAIVRALCFNPQDDLVLFSGGEKDGSVWVWNSETGQCIQKMSGHKGDVLSIKMQTDGNYAMSVGSDQKAYLWDIRQRSYCGVLDATQQAPSNHISIYYAPSGEGCASLAHQDGSVSFWDISKCQFITSCKPHLSEVRSTDFTAEGRYLATASFDGNISLIDTCRMDQLEIVKTLKHQDKVVSVKWHPFMPLLVSTSADKTARVWYPQIN